MLSLRTHNILDYVLGAALIVCPFLFAFSDLAVARNIFIVSGLTLIGYSLLTKYRYSLAKAIPLGVHMTLDVCLGVMMLFAPWLFNYRAFLSTPQLTLHFVMGLGAIGLVALTNMRVSHGVIVQSEEEDEDETPRIRRAA